MTSHDVIPTESSLSQPLPNTSTTSTHPSQRLLPNSKLQLVITSKHGTNDTIYIVPASAVSATSTATTTTTDALSTKTATVSTAKVKEQAKGPVRIGNITIYPDESALCNPPVRKYPSSQKSNIPAPSVLTDANKQTPYASTSAVKIKILQSYMTDQSSALSKEQSRACGELTNHTRDAGKKNDLLQSAIDGILTEADKSSYELTTKTMTIEKSTNPLTTPTEPIKPNIALRPSTLANQSSINAEGDLHEIDKLPSIEHIDIFDTAIMEATKELSLSSTNSIDPLSADRVTEKCALAKDGNSVLSSQLKVAMNDFNKSSQATESAELLKVGNMYTSSSMISTSDDESECHSVRKKRQGLSGKFT